MGWDLHKKKCAEKKLGVLKPFDPYNSPLCTCGPKLTLNVYNGCGYECFYCYTSTYSYGRWGRTPGTWGPRKEVVAKLQRDLAKIVDGVDPDLGHLLACPVVISLSSDPYPDVPFADEKGLRLTRTCLSMLVEAGFTLLMQTKSALVLRDLDMMRPQAAVIGMTITTADDELAAKMEPSAPSPSRRLAALGEASARGFACVCRIDPIVPGVNDSADGVEQLILKLRDAGVRQIVSSTFKKRADSAVRFRKLFPEAEERSRPYYVDREVAGYTYLTEERRRSYMRMVKEIAEGHGLAFSCCREGFPERNACACDGRDWMESPA